MTRYDWRDGAYVPHSYSGDESPRPDTHDASVEYLRRCKAGERTYDLCALIHQLQATADRLPHRALELRKIAQRLACWVAEDQQEKP